MSRVLRARAGFDCHFVLAYPNWPYDAIKVGRRLPAAWRFSFLSQSCAGAVITETSVKSAVRWQPPILRATRCRNQGMRGTHQSARFVIRENPVSGRGIVKCAEGHFYLAQLGSPLKTRLSSPLKTRLSRPRKQPRYANRPPNLISGGSLVFAQCWLWAALLSGRIVPHREFVKQSN